MDNIVAGYLSKLELGKVQQFKNMTVVPLLSSINNSPKYLTLKEALEKKLLTVTEVSEGGAVPELKVVNKAKTSVLLLDGEELVGAKQNRVLNTSILLKKQSETVIPVSCTEQGRWSYTSDEFADSGVVLSPRMREAKAAAVSASLDVSETYQADQQAVWEDIEEMSDQAAARSPTGAMKHIYESRVTDLDSYLKAFKHLPHQKGLLVLINGEVVGFDVVSLEGAYETLHPKLVKSYAMDALLEKKGKKGSVSPGKARIFLEKAKACEERQYKSTGHGWDYRFEGKKTVGSALIYRTKVIHLAFFKITETGKVGRIAGYGRRRDFRT